MRFDSDLIEGFIGIVSIMILNAFLIGFIIGGKGLILMAPGFIIIAVWLSFDTWRNG